MCIQSFNVFLAHGQPQFFVNSVLPLYNPPNLFLTGSQIEAETLPPPNPPRVRDHSVALGEEGLPLDKQPQQQRVQRLPDRRQKEAQCSVQGKKKRTETVSHLVCVRAIQWGSEN